MALDFDALVLAPAHAAFGEPVTYAPASGPSLALAGVFTDRYTQTSFQDGAEIASVRTALNVRASLFTTAPAKGDLVTVRGIQYVVNEVEPDGLGDIRFYLGLASDAQAALEPDPPS